MIKRNIEAMILINKVESVTAKKIIIALIKTSKKNNISSSYNSCIKAPFFTSIVKMELK